MGGELEGREVDKGRRKGELGRELEGREEEKRRTKGNWRKSDVDNWGRQRRNTREEEGRGKREEVIKEKGIREGRGKRGRR